MWVPGVPNRDRAVKVLGQVRTIWLFLRVRVGEREVALSLHRGLS